jgi:hypothetical protein
MATKDPEGCASDTADEVMMKNIVAIGRVIVTNDSAHTQQ